MDSLFKYDSVSLNASKDGIVILDQTLLPGKEEFITLRDEYQVRDAIASLKVRGAPAIGVAAAYGLYVAFRNLHPAPVSAEESEREFHRIKAMLLASRPTAVNLAYALKRMEQRFISCRMHPRELQLQSLLEEAESVKTDDMDRCRAIAGHGATLIFRHGMGILTHCNAGHLAVSRYGTALGPIYLAHKNGLSPKVYADETRPLLQGARITAFELMNAGVDVTLICDNMAASLMAAGKIDMVMVGCDRVAANGDTANKIGTFPLAIAARYHRIPFYVLGPESTIDRDCPCGADIPIEIRRDEEVTSLYSGQRTAPEGIKVYNPAFDVTPGELIAGIITENGIYRYPYDFTKPKQQ